MQFSGLLLGAGAELAAEVFDALSGRAGPDDMRSLALRQAEVLLELCAQAVSPTGIATDQQAADQAAEAGQLDLNDDEDEPEGGDQLDSDDSDAQNDDTHNDHAQNDDDAHDRDALNDDLGSDLGDGDLDGASSCDDRPGDDQNPLDGSSARGDSQTEDQPGVPAQSRPERPGDRRPAGDRWESARAMPCPKVAVSGRALLAVTMDLGWLQAQVGHGTLDSGHPASPTEMRRLACDCAVVPMILGGRGEPLDVGRLAYTVPDGMRRVLHVRDRGCTFPGCTRRPKRCHAHHVIHWLDSGRTELGNLTLLCSYHHHLIHHDQWSITMVGGRPMYRRPPWMDPGRTPIPGGREPVLAG